MIERVKAAAPELLTGLDPDNVSIITEALIARFGADAPEMARRQIMAATGDSIKIWIEIFARLSGSANRF